MATYDWPATALMNPHRFSFGSRDVVRRSDSPVNAIVQTSEQPYSHRWLGVITLRPRSLPAERAEQFAFLMRLRGGIHRTRFHHFGHPVPAGTMRGSPTVSGSHSQGATSLAIATTAAATIAAGDMLGVVSASGEKQLVCVVVGGTASGGGAITVTIEPHLRFALANGSAVTWDRPTALWIMEGSEWMSSFADGIAQPIEIPFREVTA